MSTTTQTQRFPHETHVPRSEIAVVADSWGDWLAVNVSDLAPGRVEVVAIEDSTNWLLTTEQAVALGEALLAAAGKADPS